MKIWEKKNDLFDQDGPPIQQITKKNTWNNNNNTGQMMPHPFIQTHTHTNLHMMHPIFFDHISNNEQSVVANLHYHHLRTHTHTSKSLYWKKIQTCQGNCPNDASDPPTIRLILVADFPHSKIIDYINMKIKQIRCSWQLL